MCSFLLMRAAIKISDSKSANFRKKQRKIKIVSKTDHMQGKNENIFTSVENQSQRGNRRV